MNKEFSFGYPEKCTKCNKAKLKKCTLDVKPYYKEIADAKRLMLIGQDPTIRDRPNRVKTVLMLNDANSQLSRFSREVFGEALKRISIYATNLVKCKLSKELFDRKKGGIKFLSQYFEHCQEHLTKEILKYKPDYAVTLGEPAHKLFIDILDNKESFNKEMKDAFIGELKPARLNGFQFQYSPLLHIQTYRVAVTYGKKVIDFKNMISKTF